MIFLFLKDFCSHLKKSNKEERENWLSSLSGMVTGDLFPLVSVCNYPPYTECAITWQRKVLYAPCHVWFSAITYHLTLSSSEVQALSSLLCTQCHIKKKKTTNHKALLTVLFSSFLKPPNPVDSLECISCILSRSAEGNASLAGGWEAGRELMSAAHLPQSLRSSRRLPGKDPKPLDTAWPSRTWTTLRVRHRSWQWVEVGEFGDNFNLYSLTFSDVPLFERQLMKENACLLKSCLLLRKWIFFFNFIYF